MRDRILVSWSSGKDSAWMLHQLGKRDDIEIAGLLTTLNEQAGRVAMHGVRREILEAQAEAAGLPLHQVMLPHPCPNEVYEQRMAEALEQCPADGIRRVAFGDLFLEDIRAYRIRQFESLPLKPVFPIWRQPTGKLARDMVDAGIEAVVVCLDPKQLDPSFIGRRFDHRLLDELPETVDPCGENGEFHTCVLAGPMFDRALPVMPGDAVERDGFFYQDLVLDRRG